MEGDALTRREAIARIAFAVLVALSCAGLISAAALVPAPPGVLPLVAIVSVACPMAVTGELHAGIRALQRRRRALATLRRHLAQLPETSHPLERG
jgi:hypothetical protein